MPCLTGTLHSVVARDQNSPVDALKNRIDFQQKLIGRYQDQLEKAALRPDAAEANQRVKHGQLMWTLDLFSLQYSAGATPSELRDFLVGVVDAALAVDVFAKANNRYEEKVWLSSWAVLLDDSQSLERLGLVIEPDVVANVVLRVLHGMDVAPHVDSEGQLPMYLGLREAIQLAVNGQMPDASERLVRYVDKEWYRDHVGFRWHNQHDDGAYIGYWSWPAAAVAKVYGIDDSALEGHKYYPWELAHPG